MTELAEFLSAINKYGGSFGAVIAFGWAVWQFFDVRRRDFRNREFEVYHRLIKELVQPEKEAGIFLDRQIAIVFELRHFDRYHELSTRLLAGLREQWGQGSDVAKYRRLLEEIDLTLMHLERRAR